MALAGLDGMPAGDSGGELAIALSCPLSRQNSVVYCEVVRVETRLCCG
jgi:hypothetical protein